MNMTKLILAAILLTSLSLVASTASASMMTYNGMALYSTVTLHDQYQTNGATTYAGQERLTIDGVDSIGYCVDIAQWAGNGEVTWQPLAGLPRGNLVAYLLDQHANLAATNDTAAALGVAIWEVLYESSGQYNAGEAAFNGIDHGEFYITGNDTVVSLANTWLSSIPADYTSTTNWQVVHSDSVQDYAIVGPQSSVTEPVTAAVLALGGVGALLRYRSGRTA